MQAGASPAAVSAVLGHADLRITMERYAALAPEFLRSEVERLKLGVPAPAEAAAVAEVAAGFAASLLHEPRRGKRRAGNPFAFREGFPALVLERETGFEPATLSLGS